MFVWFFEGEIKSGGMFICVNVYSSFIVFRRYGLRVNRRRCCLGVYSCVLLFVFVMGVS